ncbi:MAG: porin family protein [Planctomycetota bacterium]
MRKLIVLSLASCVLARGAFALETRYGAEFGWNLAGVTGDAEENGYADRSSGIMFGGLVELGVTDTFAFQTGLRYETKGAEGVHYADGTALVYDAAYLVVPAVARFDLAGGNAHASAGFAFGFPVKAERSEGGPPVDVTDELGTELALVLGLGGDVCDLGTGGALSLGVAYSYSLNEVADDSDIRNSVISVVMGLRF